MQIREAGRGIGSGRQVVLGVVLVGLLGASQVLAGDITQKAREILARSQNSIITVSALSKLDMSGSGLPIRIGGLGEAQETSCAGVVVDSSGLTIVSYSALNPMEKVANAIKIKMGGEDGDSDNEAKGKAEMSRIQMRLADGTEIAGRVVLKDKELDLAVLAPAPKEGEKVPKFSSLKLVASAKASELDDIVVISRHGKSLGCQPMVDIGRITSVVKKPRAMYDLSVGARPGSPVFLADEKLLGITIMYSSGGGGMMSMGAMEMLVLPTSEVIKLVDEAKKAVAKK